MRVSEIRVNQIRVNQGLGVFTYYGVSARQLDTLNSPLCSLVQSTAYASSILQNWWK